MMCTCQSHFRSSGIILIWLNHTRNMSTHPILLETLLHQSWGKWDSRSQGTLWRWVVTLPPGQPQAGDGDGVKGRALQWAPELIWRGKDSEQRVAVQGHRMFLCMCVWQELWPCKGTYPWVQEKTQGEVLFLEYGGKEKWQKPLLWQLTARDSRKKARRFWYASLNREVSLQHGAGIPAGLVGRGGLVQVLQNIRHRLLRWEGWGSWGHCLKEVLETVSIP